MKHSDFMEIFLHNLTTRLEREEISLTRADIKDILQKAEIESLRTLLDNQ